MTSDCSGGEPGFGSGAPGDGQETAWGRFEGGEGTADAAFAPTSSSAGLNFVHTAIGYGDAGKTMSLLGAHNVLAYWMEMPASLPPVPAADGAPGCEGVAGTDVGPGSDVRAGSNVGVVLLPPCRTPAPVAGAGRRLMLGVAADVLDRALARRGGPRLEPGRQTWDVGRTLDGPAVATLLSFAHFVMHELDRPAGSAASSASFERSLERTLLALVVECLAPPPVGRRRGGLSLFQLRRIDAWMAAHAGEPVGVADMARVAGTGVRELQSGFRRLRGCTPTQALARHRLETARAAQSTRAGREGTTVTRAAMDAGFQHLGRFARSYVRMFGEKPSATLACTRARAAMAAAEAVLHATGPP